MFKTIGSISRLHVHVARDLIRKNKIGFLIFAFVFEIRPILFPMGSAGNT